MKKHIEWIDIAKGICIFLVVFVHCTTNPYDNRYNQVFLMIVIHSFVMPCFFFLSGYVFSAGRYSEVISFVKGKAKRIMLPCLEFMLILLIFHVLQCVILDKGYEFFKSLFSVAGIANTVLLTKNSAFPSLWFLPALFCVYLYAYFLEKYIKKKMWMLISSFCIFFAALIYADNVAVGLPMCIEIAAASQFFFVAGYCLKNVESFERLTSKWYMTVIAVAALIVFNGVLVFGFKQGVTPLHTLRFYNPVAYLACAFIGIFALSGVAKLLQGVTILKEFGYNSLYIYGMHFIPLNIYEMLVNKLFYNCSYLTCQIIAAVSAITIIIIIILFLKIWGVILANYNINKHD